MMTLAASAVRFLCERAVRIYCKTIGIREVTKKVNDLVRRRGWEGGHRAGLDCAASLVSLSGQTAMWVSLSG